MLEGRVNACVYTCRLATNLTPLLNSRFDQGGFFFIQDNPKVHVTKATKNYLKSQKNKTS